MHSNELWFSNWGRRNGIWPTKTDVTSPVTTASIPDEIEIRKSKRSYIAMCLACVFGLALLVSAIWTQSWGYYWLNIIFLIAVILCGWFGIQGLRNRTIQLIISKKGIQFRDGAFLPWPSIIKTSIEQRFHNISRGSGIEQFFLHVRPDFSGAVSGQPVEQIIEITMFEYSHRQIAHFIELYKKMDRMDRIIASVAN